MNWYLKVLRDNYANFEGRARRTEYWMFQLFNIIALIVLEVVMGIFTAISPKIGMLFGVLVVIYALGLIVPSLAVATRRLHDTGRSGWWQLIALVPLVGGIILFVFTVLDSQPGENIYGPNPKDVA